MSDDVRYLIDQSRGRDGSLDFGMLLLLLLVGGRNGLIGNQGADCAQNMSLLNAINQVAEKVVATGCQIAEAGRANTASLEASFTNQFNGLSNSMARGFDNMISSNNLQSAAIGEGFTRLSSYLCNMNSDLMSAISCSTNNINTNTNNGFTTTNANLFNLGNAVKDFACATQANFVHTDCKIDKLSDKVDMWGQKIIDNQNLLALEAEKKSLHAALEIEKAKSAELAMKLQHQELLLAIQAKGNDKYAVKA